MACRVHEVHAAATEEALARVPRGEAADVDAAVNAARAAFTDPTWAEMSPDRRGRILNQIADVIEEHADELATIDSVNMGAPRMLTAHMLAEASEVFRYYAGWPTKLSGVCVPAGKDRMAYTRKGPSVSSASSGAGTVRWANCPASSPRPWPPVTPSCSSRPRPPR
ncbi:aldehyde dehydrogenase family protein [Streptomyces sp. DSM 40712]|uniref:Aldehyde dehydrogenase family protein n=1 Tax=Streptomyces lancefieldiae TaxID=3075520 RepID=A0ABU3AFB9_9ACTN|nr:aldehyde dehydrogenase family protein [Streptomyces sp. DSM 40712]MDT0608684.1 aldehyde dehydrogenase family protein [Streptomyces sp. DSM 40712]